MRVTFDHSETIGHAMQTFWFKPEKSQQYIAGQFTELHLPHAKADTRGERRWFTLSSSPTEPLLGVTTKFSTEHGSSFKHALAALQPGTALTLADAMGDFVLPKDVHTKLIFVVGGMGITPVRSMVKWLLDSGEQRNIHVMYAVTKAEDLAFEPLLQSYPGKLTTVISSPRPGYAGETGRLDSQRILQLAGDDGQSLFYLSGPELMVETFNRELLAKGIHKSRVVGDYFPGYPAV